MASRSEIARQDQASEQRRDTAVADIIRPVDQGNGDANDHKRWAADVLSALIEAMEAESADIAELRRKGWQSAMKAHITAAEIVKVWRDLLVSYKPPGASALPQPVDIAVSNRADNPTELDARLEAAFRIPPPIRHIRTVIEPITPSEANSEGQTYGALCGSAGGNWTQPGGSNCVDCHLAYAEQNGGKPYDGPGHVDVPALLAGRPEAFKLDLSQATPNTADMDESAIDRINALADGSDVINATVEAGQTYVLEGTTVRRVDGPVTPTLARTIREQIEAENVQSHAVGDKVVVGGIEFTKHSEWPREIDGSPSPGTAADVAAVAMPTVVEPPARRPARLRLTAAQVREHGLARQRGAEHRSVSQVSGHADCGTRYAISDLERPAWWNVGGRAFHACAEEINHSAVAKGFGPLPLDSDGARSAQESLWLRHFDAQIVEQSAARPEHPMDTWRAANRGSEHYDFWRVEGPAMVQKYVVWLQSMLQEGWSIATAPFALATTGSPAAAPVIEYSVNLDVGLQVPNLSIIDLALIDDAGRVIIVDLKAGSSAPKDTFQLGVYGWCALAAGVAQRPEQVRGAYYRARKGELTAPMPILDMHPWPDVVQRYRDQDAMDRAGIYAPNVTTFCGGCGVRDLCPAQS